MTYKNLDDVSAFAAEKSDTIAKYPHDTVWQSVSREWMKHAFNQRYMYNFTWLGQPIIQLPADIVAIQEIIWEVKPDLIIEIGIARGGSLFLSASMLALLDVCDSVSGSTPTHPKNTGRQVLGVDIDIRAHNRELIEAHPMSNWITMIEGSSLEKDIMSQVHAFAKGYDKVLVLLDSNHTHDHVLSELEAYAPLTSKGSYCIVFDTIVEDLPDDMFPDRPWSPGNSPKTAVREYLKNLNETGSFASDGMRLQFSRHGELENKLMLTVAPEGFLKRV